MIESRSIHFAKFRLATLAKMSTGSLHHQLLIQSQLLHSFRHSCTRGRATSVADYIFWLDAASGLVVIKSHFTEVRPVPGVGKLGPSSSTLPYLMSTKVR